MVRTLLPTPCLLLFATLSVPALAGTTQAVRFSENKGQWPAQVLYRAHTAHGAVFIERDALTYVVRSGGGAHGHAPGGSTEALHEHAYRVHFEGGRATSYRGENAAADYENYFIGNDRAKWASKVGIYGSTVLHQVYPGVDMRVSGQSGLKYDLLVAAGADASRIALRYEGHTGLRVEDGKLLVGTSAGAVVEEAPLAWQQVNGKRKAVRCAYALSGDVVRFTLPDGYDHRYALTIDPTVIFGTYTGSTADNFGFTATYDQEGHLYGGGIVFGFGYPVTLGVQQPAFAGGVIDVSLTKFSSDGTSLIWSTYLGGATGNESPHSLVVNDTDELYVMGTTGSSEFPTTTGCFDNAFGSGPAVSFGIGEGYDHPNGVDMFVTHFNTDATALIGSTYVGGSGTDGINNSFITAYNYGDPFRGEIVLDAQQHPTVASCTTSLDIPVTANAPFPVFAGGLQDGYVFEMDPALSTQTFATFYGGTSDDACYSVQLDGSGNLFTTGGSNSGDLPMTGTPMDATANGDVDGFIARFDPSAGTFTASTYLGTPTHDESYFVQLDTNDRVYVVGQTHGAYPVTPGKFTVPNSSQFIHKLSNDLSTSIWSTVIGSGSGTEDIAPSAFLVSDCGQIYFSGWGGAANAFGQALNSSTFGLPVTVDAFQSTTDGSDFYLAVLGQEAVSLDYATFFGGSVSQEHVDGGTSRFDKNGIVYQAVCAGCGSNDDFPTTPGAWSNTNNSFNCNLGLFKIDFDQGVSANIGGEPLTGCAPVTINFLSTGSGTSWTWDFGDGTAVSHLQNPPHLFNEPGIYPVTLIAVDSNACNVSDTLVLDIVISSPTAVQPAFATLTSTPCGEYVVVATNNTSGPSNTYLWNMGDGNTYNTEDVTHTYAAPGTYTITLTATDPVCGTTDSTQQSVTFLPDAPLDALFAASSSDFCSGLTVTAVDQSTGSSGLSLTWDMGDGTTLTGTPVQHTYTDAGTYTITLVAVDPLCGENDSFSATVTVVPSTAVGAQFIIPNIFSPNGDGENDTFFPIPGAGTGIVHLQVFNRWGMKLYETAGTYRPWNGDVRPGDKAPDGVYYYLLDYDLPCGDTPLRGREKGYVHIVR